MPRPTNTIRLAAARTIFSGVQFQEIKVNEYVVGYKAIYAGAEYTDRGLTSLCERLWALTQPDVPAFPRFPDPIKQQ